MRGEVAEDIRTIFIAPTRDTAETYLKKAIEKYSVIAPKMLSFQEIKGEITY